MLRGATPTPGPKPASPPSKESARANSQRLCDVDCRLGGGLLKVGDEIGAILWLLQAGEDHLGSGDVLLGRQKVIEKRLLAPDHGLLLVGLGVRVALLSSRLPAEEAAEVGALESTETKNE